MDNYESNKYKVGYKKPPVKNQFQPGKSGNPRGRPKKSELKCFADLIDEELSEEILIKENNIEKKITKKQAIAKRLVNGGMTLKPEALKILKPHLENEKISVQKGPVIYLPHNFRDDPARQIADLHIIDESEIPEDDYEENDDDSES
jgi:hypothetical protein